VATKAETRDAAAEASHPSLTEFVVPVARHRPPTPWPIETTSRSTRRRGTRWSAACPARDAATRRLLRHAVEFTVAASGTIGEGMLVVAALNLTVAVFYQRFGFSPSPTNPLDLMITVVDIKASM
jgi:hypothetical protein